MIKIPRILHLEDDKNDAELARRELERAGLECHMVTVANQDQFSQALENGPYDLVLSDIRMPVMDGIEMAQAAARAHPGIRILLMTGYAEQRERAAELSAIIVDVVQKPFTLAQIRSEVERALAA